MDVTALVVERCPACRSDDVRVVETDFFVVDLDRADDLRSPWAADVEFSCRACGVVWS